MKINYLRRKRKAIIQEEKHKELEESGSSGNWNTILDTGLTKSEADDKIIQEKQILTFNQDGTVNKVSESNIKKEIIAKKGFDVKYLNVGYYILVPMVGSIAIGILLDNHFNTKPIFIGIFLFLGTVAGFYNLFKLLKE